MLLLNGVDLYETKHNLLWVCFVVFDLNRLGSAELDFGQKLSEL